MSKFTQALNFLYNQEIRLLYVSELFNKAPITKFRYCHYARLYREDGYSFPQPEKPTFYLKKTDIPVIIVTFRPENGKHFTKLTNLSE